MQGSWNDILGNQNGVVGSKNLIQGGYNSVVGNQNGMVGSYNNV